MLGSEILEEIVLCISDIAFTTSLYPMFLEVSKFEYRK